MRPFFYIANWKMNQTLAHAQEFVHELTSDATIASLPVTTKIVLCPSFPHIGFLAPKLKDTPFTLGAQSCSPHDSGAYTGQVAASALAEIGCTYCLIGHSERRLFRGETDDQVVSQYNQLVRNNLTPVVCIGESEKEYKAKETLIALERQLNLLIKVYQENSATTLLIAYEPVWAIGSGKTPTNTEIAALFVWLKNHLKNNFPRASTFLLYGGSVDETNSPTLKTIDHLDGLLIGSASLTFKNFKNIVV